jgi:hypothetical protein
MNLISQISKMCLVAIMQSQQLTKMGRYGFYVVLNLKGSSIFQVKAETTVELKEETSHVLSKPIGC